MGTDCLFVFFQKFFKDPYTTTLSGFSKVTGLVRDAFQVPQGETQQTSAAFSYSSLLVGDFEGLDPYLLSPGTEDQGFEFVEAVSQVFLCEVLSHHSLTSCLK